MTHAADLCMTHHVLLGYSLHTSFITLTSTVDHSKEKHRQTVDRCILWHMLPTEAWRALRSVLMHTRTHTACDK